MAHDQRCHNCIVFCMEMEQNGSTGHLVKLKQKIWWNNSSSPLSYQTKLFTVMTYLLMTDYTIH